MALEEGADTGPGLEGAVSWDYSQTEFPSVSASDVIAAVHTASKKELSAGFVPLPATRPKDQGPSGRHANGVVADSPFAHQHQWDPRQSHQASPQNAVPEVSATKPTVDDETPEQQRARLKEEARAARAEKAAQAMSLSVLCLLLLAAILFLVLAYTGWNQYAAAAALFCTSIAGYPALQLLWFALSSQTFRCWGKLTPYEQFYWSQKGSSLVHSSIMAIVGLSIVLRPDWRKLDLVLARDERVAAFIGLELGYLLQDTGMEVHKQLRFGRSFSLLHWIHHIAILALLPLYYRYKKGDFFLGAFFLWNTSTVPLQLRWFQKTAGLQSGPLFQLNNVALLVSFLACRILIVPFLMHVFAERKGWTLYQVPFKIPRVCTAACAIFILINGIWLFSLLRHAFRRKKRIKSS